MERKTLFCLFQLLITRHLPYHVIAMNLCFDKINILHEFYLYQSTRLNVMWWLTDVHEINMYKNILVFNTKIPIWICCVYENIFILFLKAFTWLIVAADEDLSILVANNIVLPITFKYNKSILCHGNLNIRPIFTVIN